MTAIVVDGPDQTMSVERIPVPRPLRGEVLIRVAACGACHTDLHVMRGEYAFPYPCVLGHEVAGQVVELGEGVDHLAVDDRVVASFVMPCGMCGPCARGDDNLCERFFGLNRARGVLYDGTTRLRRSGGEELAMFSAAGLAEYSVIPATSVFRVPDSVPLESASILGCSLLTAYGAARHAADLRAGQTVAVVAAGGVGLGIIQLAKIFGASRIIAIDIGPDKLETASRLDASEVIDVSDRDPVGRVRELTSGKGVDVAFEALGTPRTLEQAFMMTADGGTTVLVGVGSGDAAASIPLTHLLRHQVRIIGSYGGRPRTDMPLLLDMAASEQFDLDSNISLRRPLTEAESVYSALAAGSITGRAILTSVS
ncbi:zinc-binding dehydrogenase [Brevibacterium album]|uniref:zinc-binding dehydrogenase n=1 Tax=Brevibacterium album TaxID=417948 RepID=UPI00048EA37D|nr:zinc-binding dehydrogenase [Brevibacterium album]